MQSAECCRSNTKVVLRANLFRLRAAPVGRIDKQHVIILSMPIIATECKFLRHYSWLIYGAGSSNYMFQRLLFDISIDRYRASVSLASKLFRFQPEQSS